MNRNGKAVAIIGAGASGTILAYQLVEKAAENSESHVTVFLIEKGDVFGPGLAYSTPLSSHILNMRSNTLGVLDNNPRHFFEWMNEKKELPGDAKVPSLIDIYYPPRSLYGKYIKDILNRTIKKAPSFSCSINLVKGEAVDVLHNGNSIEVIMTDGNIIKSDYAVLAPGNFPSTFLQELKDVKGYIPSPWPVSSITDTVPRDCPVCILGAGLSAIDTLLTLVENDHRGKITFLSRRGFLPKVQGDFSEYRLKYLDMDNIKEIIQANGYDNLPLDIVRGLFFKEIEAAEGNPIDWLHVFNPEGSVTDILKRDISRAKSGRIPYQSALNEAGPLTVIIWNLLSVEDRFRFDNELKTLWTVYRHPMPVINAEKILDVLKKGQLDIGSGCMCVRSSGTKGFEIDIGTRFGVPYALKTPYIINATGQGLDVTKFNDILIERLLKKGLIMPHPNGGIVVDFETGMVKGREGKKIQGLFALGEITRGVYFFTNGIVPNMVSSAGIADQIIGPTH